jgi:tetratricopeptide (TPR) repeat protein
MTPLRLPTLLLIFVGLLVLLTFSPVLHNGFVDWDDNENFLHNDHFRGLGTAQLRWAWTTPLLGVYQPIAWMLLETQAALWDLNATGYHAVSLVLHAVNSVLLCCLIVALLRRCQPRQAQESSAALWLAASLAAALYAVHPLRAEVAAWASCQPYLPCSALMMLALLSYLRAYDENISRGKWLAVTWMLAGAAMLCKAPAVSLPAVLLILDAYPLRRWHTAAALKRSLVEKLPFVLLGVLFMLVTAQVRSGTIVPIKDDGLLWRAGLACYSICFYPIKTIWPLDLSNLYALPFRPEVRAIQFALSALFAVGVSVLCLWLRRRWPGLLTAWLAYLVLLAPVASFVRSGPTTTADRYCYLPMMAWTLVLAGGLWAGLVHFRGRRAPLLAGSLVALVLLGSLATLSWRRCLVWHDGESLWTDAASRSGSRNPERLANLASILISQHKPRQALPWLRRAVLLRPEAVYPQKLLGLVLVELRLPAEALPHLIAAAHLEPDDVETAFNLGMAYAALEQNDDAGACFIEAIRLRPTLTAAHAHLGLVLTQQRRWAEALPPLREALRQEPKNAEVLYHLGSACMELGKHEEAMRNLREAVRLDPRYAEAVHALGFLLARQDQLDEAVVHLRRALELRPDYSEASLNLAWTLARQEKLEEAMPHFRKAMAGKSEEAQAHQGLGMALARSGRMAEAVIEFRAVLRLNPDAVEPRFQLAAVLSALEDWEEAADQFTEVLRRDPAHAGSQRGLSVAHKHRQKQH